jgi:hypothetical protein
MNAPEEKPGNQRRAERKKEPWPGGKKETKQNEKENR